MKKVEKQPKRVCGARLRGRFTLCSTPPEVGKSRCRIHGAAEGVGAPKGNRNAVKHGYYTTEKQAIFKAAKKLLNTLLP